MFRWIFVIIMLVVAPSYGEFFWRTRATAGRVLADFGAVCMYKTDVEVNGRPGTLSCFSLTGMRAQELQKRLAGKKYSGKCVVVPSPSGADECAVFAFEGDASGDPSQAAVPPEVPEGMEVAFSAVCKKTRTSLVTLNCATEVEGALEAVAQNLRSKGWNAVGPQDFSSKRFTFGTKECIIYGCADGSGGSRVTLLKREGSEK